MITIETQEYGRIDLRASASEITWGEQIDILFHLKQYNTAIKDENDLDASLHFMAAAKVYVPDFESIELLQLYSPAGDELTVEYLVQCAADAIANVTEGIEGDGRYQVLAKSAIERLRAFKSPYFQTIELQAFEANIDSDPFTASKLTSRFYSITLKQAALLFYPKVLETIEHQAELDKVLAEKGEEIKGIDANTMHHLRNEVLGFWKAWRNRDPQSSLPSKARITNHHELNQPTTKNGQDQSRMN